MLRNLRLLIWLSLLAANRAHLRAALPAKEGSFTQQAGNTFYVDAVTGNDANDGLSPQRPWKTLALVNATTFHPGDTILFKAGAAWDGQLWPKGSGEPDRPIRVGAYGGGAKPVIRAAGQFADAVLLKNQEHWEIEDLDVSNSGAKLEVRRGVHVTLNDFGEAHHIVLRRLTVHDVNGDDQLKPNGGIIVDSAGANKRSRFVDLRIEDNEVYATDRNGITTWSDAWQRSKWYPSLGVVVRGNRLRDIGGDGILVTAADGALIERNVVEKANQRSAGYNVAIWSWSADDTIVQYNEASGTKGERDGEGFDSDWNSRNTLIQYNYSHDNDGGFILICNEGSYSPSDSVGNVGTIVRYNISQNDRHRGITLSGPVQNTAIYNNTLYVSQREPVDMVLFTDWFGWPQETRFTNNIFYAENSAHIGHATARSEQTGHHSSSPGFGPSKSTSFDANVYFGPLEKVADPRGLTTDPQFADAGHGADGRNSLTGYSLKSASPARATGQPVHDNGAQDFFAAPLANCTKPDRGAVQSSRCASR